MKTIVQFSMADGLWWVYIKRNSDNCYTKWRLATEQEIKNAK
jgi:hypothetical protein